MEDSVQGNLQRQRKLSTPLLGGGNVSKSSRIPKASGRSQKHLRREHRSTTLASTPARRRHTHKHTRKTLTTSDHTLSTATMSRPTKSDDQSPIPMQPITLPPPQPHASSSKPPHEADTSSTSDTSTHHAVLNAPSSASLPLGSHPPGNSSTAVNLSYDSLNENPVTTTTAEQSPARSDHDVASFSTRHSPRQVQVHHRRQGPHERVEAPGVGERRSRSREERKRGEQRGAERRRSEGQRSEVEASEVTPVRTRSQGTIIRSPPPTGQKSLKVRILKFLLCCGRL
ncbi:hypothetical protein EV356DRAFT_513474 [Viridothelium virens]|uniref:Uncharacterized protein n=1 Tax=Viridothelium virens TaxID=1048519 RepID=A0A6A6HCY2_VIRVR|nr:hypothetical protein EV356DRAFT_513474 [Viridothelium virens]